jgi:hypothetical protein
MGEVAQFTGGKVPAKLKALAGDNTDHQGVTLARKGW